MRYTRKTRDLYVLQVYRPRVGRRRSGWADLHTEFTSKAAYDVLLSYRLMLEQKCRYRIVKRRPVTDASQ